MKQLLLGFLLFSCMFLDAKTGEKLTRQFWKDSQEKNIQALKKNISSGFHSVLDEKRRDKKEELAFIKNRTIKTFSLSQVKVSKKAKFMTVTYLASVDEIVGGVLQNSTKPYTTIWKKYGSSWKVHFHGDAAHPQGPLLSLEGEPTLDNFFKNDVLPSIKKADILHLMDPLSTLEPSLSNLFRHWLRDTQSIYNPDRWHIVPSSSSIFPIEEKWYQATNFGSNGEFLILYLQANDTLTGLKAAFFV